MTKPYQQRRAVVNTLPLPRKKGYCPAGVGGPLGVHLGRFK